MKSFAMPVMSGSYLLHLALCLLSFMASIGSRVKVQLRASSV